MSIARSRRRAHTLRFASKAVRVHVVEQPKPVFDTSCACGGTGQMLMMYSRNPNDFPGNTFVPCPYCNKMDARITQGAH